MDSNISKKRQLAFESYQGIAEDYFLSLEDLEEYRDIDFLAFDTPFTTSNGVMMGDPGTKGLLTLLNLAAEVEAHEAFTTRFGQSTTKDIVEEADFEFVMHLGPAPGQPAPFGAKAAMMTMNLNMDPRQTIEYDNVSVEDPRFFSCAGDDHAAVGDRRKLQLITEAHRANSMVPSEMKQFTSPIGLVYCERLLLRTTLNEWKFDPKDYERTYMVDSVKIRLLSPCTKAVDLANEPNPAIGKAKQLFHQNEWLPGDWTSVRDKLVPLRFKQRFYHHLPHLPNGQIDPIVELPFSLGGLSVRSPMDTRWDDVVDHLSENHIRVLLSVIDGSADKRAFRALRSLMKDRYARGIEFGESVIDAYFNELDGRLDPGPMDLKQTVREYDLPDVGAEPSYAAKRRRLEKHNFVSERDARRAYSRGSLQKKLLAENPTQGWTMSPWPARRAAFERTLSNLVEAYFNEGRIDKQIPAENAVATLLESIELMTSQELEKLDFEEDLFYKIDAKIQPESSDKEPIYPIKEFIEHLTKLELPTVNDCGWFPKNSPKQTALSD